MVCVQADGDGLPQCTVDHREDERSHLHGAHNGRESVFSPTARLTHGRPLGDAQENPTGPRLTIVCQPRLSFAYNGPSRVCSHRRATLRRHLPVCSQYTHTIHHMPLHYLLLWLPAMTILPLQLLPSWVHRLGLTQLRTGHWLRSPVPTDGVALCVTQVATGSRLTRRHRTYQPKPPPSPPACGLQWHSTARRWWRPPRSAFRVHPRAFPPRRRASARSSHRRSFATGCTVPQVATAHRAVIYASLPPPLRPHRHPRTRCARALLRSRPIK